MKKLILFCVCLIGFSGCVSKNSDSPMPLLPDPVDISSEISQIPTSQIVPPISRYSERITKKPFSIKVRPDDSPVEPEKFYGYHTGTDFEIFPEELTSDVVISAVCDGPLVVKKIASGYGGVVAQLCSIDNSDVTVIYGHLKLTSVDAKIGDMLNKNDLIGILGDAYSAETDGERKHLHVSIHKGKKINILGYVQTEKELEEWINFEKLI